MISKLVPKFIKDKLYQLATKRYKGRWQDDFLSDWNKDFFEKRVRVEKEIPKYDLQYKHIKNLSVVVNREDLLKKMSTNAICAEIGVNEGEFSEAILKITQPQKLHLIDAWGDPNRYHDGLKIMVKEKFRSEIENKQIEINVGFSIDILRKFPDQYFDWVYLDTDHTYSVTAAELNILKDKVKRNGIIAGHDYIIGNWVGNFRYGVIEAVHELCANEDWELVYITINKNEMPSFAIRKL